MTQKLIYVLVVVAVLAGLYLTFGSQKSTNDDNSEVACTLEAMVCPDGTTVGRTGPNCEFAACPGVTDSGVPKDIQDHIDSKSDLIKLDEPDPLDIVTSPITIQGEASLIRSDFESI